MEMLNPKALGIAGGGLCGLYIFCLGLAATYLGWGEELIEPISSFYRGYEATLVGSIFGAIWGMIDGFIAGYIFALIYNWARKKYK